MGKDQKLAKTRGHIQFICLSHWQESKISKDKRICFRPSNFCDFEVTANFLRGEELETEKNDKCDLYFNDCTGRFVLWFSSFKYPHRITHNIL